MQLNSKNKAFLIAEVGHKSLSICVPNSREVAVLKFPDSSIVDMEITNQDELKQLVNNFLQEKKLTKSQVILVLHDSLCFEVKLSGLNPIEQDLKYNSFLETVPLESVIARKVIIDDKTAYGAAINRQIYEFFNLVFAVWGLDVTVAVPSIAVRSLGYEGQLSDKVCLLLAKKVKLLRQCSFFEEHDPSEHFAKTQRNFIEKHKIVAGVLSTVFVAIALITSVLTLRVSTPPPKVIPVIAREEIITPTPTVIIEPTVIPIKTAELVSVVTSTTAQRNTSQLMREELIRLGVSKIELKSATVATEVTQLGFSAQVAPADRSAITEYVKKTFTEVAETTIEGTDVDVEIILGKVN